MTTKKKVRLFVLSGKKAGDVNALAKLFEKLTGRKPTLQELSDAKRELEAPHRSSRRTSIKSVRAKQRMR